MLITTMWKSSRIPTPRDWYSKVWNLYLQDKISLSLLRAENVPLSPEMLDKWEPLLLASATQRIDTSLFANHEHLDLLSHL